MQEEGSIPSQREARAPRSCSLYKNVCAVFVPMVYFIVRLTYQIFNRALLGLGLVMKPPERKQHQPNRELGLLDLRKHPPL